VFGKAIVRGLGVTGLVCCGVVAQAVNIETVPVGNPGNVGEWSGESLGDGWAPDRICGAVDYRYQIGKYEVTVGQYTEFLNAKAKSDPYGLYNTQMANNPAVDYQIQIGCNLQRTGSEGNYSYSVSSDWANRPVNWVSFWDAARFTNWLSNGQGDGDTETGAYTLNGYNDQGGRWIVRNAGAKWVIPSEDEWYKAAYHKNDGVTGNYWDYPTGVDMSTTPGSDTSELTNPGNNANYPSGSTGFIGSPYYLTTVGEFELSDSPYGTFDQGGNVWEWNETVITQWDSDSIRGCRGGSYMRSSETLLAAARFSWYPAEQDWNIGFRVACVPEPASLAMLAGVALTAMFCWRRKRA
jgi:formylglycine-generating enzyme